MFARNAEYEGLVEARCESPGTPLRAPTADRGLDVFCRDSFFGEVSHNCGITLIRLHPLTAGLHTAALYTSAGVLAHG